MFWSTIHRRKPKRCVALTDADRNGRYEQTDNQVKIHQLPELIGSRVKIQAWVHRFRPQAKHFFLVLRDGTQFAQAILTGDCIRTLDALDLTVESTIEVKGTVEKVKEGQSAPGGVELVVDWWRILGKAPGGSEAFEGRLREVSALSDVL